MSSLLLLLSRYQDETSPQSLALKRNVCVCIALIHVVKGHGEEPRCCVKRRLLFMNVRLSRPRTSATFSVLVEMRFKICGMLQDSSPCSGSWAGDPPPQSPAYFITGTMRRRRPAAPPPPPPRLSKAIISTTVASPPPSTHNSPQSVIDGNAPRGPTPRPGTPPRARTLEGGGAKS